MVEPPEYKAIIQKLLEKTRAGRVAWAEGGDQFQFRCNLSEDLPGGEEYVVYIRTTENGYALRMAVHQRILFSVAAEEEIVYRDPEKKEIFDILSELYELARRRALNIPERLASVAELLDRL